MWQSHLRFPQHGGPRARGALASPHRMKQDQHEHEWGDSPSTRDEFPLAHPPEHCRAQSRPFWRQARVHDAAALVDGENYFRAFHQCAARAQRYILVAGWQFELDTRLLRGTSGKRSDLPIRLWPFLRALCERAPGLHVYVLGWDYSLVYVLEREWLQALRARLRSHPRMALAYRSHPEGLGSHHQKLAIIDGELAFVGGIDFCEARWDTRRHLPRDNERRSGPGWLSKPYHDLQAAVTGPVVSDLTELFERAWRTTSSEPLRLTGRHTAVRRPRELAAMIDAELLPLPRAGLVLCRTQPRTGASAEVREIQGAYQQLIRRAQQLIYIETQYFTSSAIGNALLERMAALRQPKLALIIILPNEADSAKEHFVLGGRQRHILSRLRADAARYGHQLRVLYVSGRDADNEPVSTFIHSKLMIVDDRALTFGSANLTNRSMSFDSELNLTWNLEPPADPVASIRDLRASLMAEHAGRNPALFADSTALIERLDCELLAPDSRLRRHPVHDAPEDDSLWTAVFDPSTELWTRHHRQLRAYVREAKGEGWLRRSLWTVQLALRLAVARSSRNGRRRARQESDSLPQPSGSGTSARVLALKFVMGLLLLYGAVAVAGEALAEPLQELGRALVATLGLPGFALGTFLADGLHFPVPPQFYMLLTVALGTPPAWSLLSIAAGSLAGGMVGFVVAVRVSRVRWLEARAARLHELPFTRHLQRYPYRWVALASLTPVAFSWLCYLAGFQRLPRRALLLLCLLRVPKLAIYFAIVRAGWLHLAP